jgi:hypothetical protein
MVGWPVYGTLYITVLEIFDGRYSAAAGVSWILSYGVVYAFQKYGTWTPGEMKPVGVSGAIAKYIFQFL